MRCMLSYPGSINLLLPYLYVRGNTIIRIANPIYVIIGTSCNAMAMAVFIRPSLYKLTASFLLFFLAITDTLSLCLPAIDMWLKTFNGWYMSSTTSLSCKVYAYFYVIVSSLSSWILVLVTFERVIVLMCVQGSATPARHSPSTHLKYPAREGGGHGRGGTG